MESWLFLALILVVALVGKNMSLIIATVAFYQQMAAYNSSQRDQLGCNRHFRGYPDSDCYWTNWF